LYNIEKIIYFLILVFFIPVFIIYLFFCFTIPLIKIGKKQKDGNIKIYICKDLIHSDFLFESDLFKNIFPESDRYIKIGWGDRKIFLETKSWSQLKIKDFLFAFFGLNKTVLRIDYTSSVPDKCGYVMVDENQLKIIKDYILYSFEKKIIEKKPEYYQHGIFYESKLNYNCITNCNNWINQCLRKANATNRLWCPLSVYL